MITLLLAIAIVAATYTTIATIERHTNSSTVAITVIILACLVLGGLSMITLNTVLFNIVGCILSTAVISPMIIDLSK